MSGTVTLVSFLPHVGDVGIVVGAGRGVDRGGERLETAPDLLAQAAPLQLDGELVQDARGIDDQHTTQHRAQVRPTRLDRFEPKLRGELGAAGAATAAMGAAAAAAIEAAAATLLVVSAYVARTASAAHAPP